MLRFIECVELNTCKATRLDPLKTNEWRRHSNDFGGGGEWGEGEGQTQWEHGDLFGCGFGLGNTITRGYRCSRQQIKYDRG